MSDQPHLDELKKLSDKLASLMADPQTGMFSWHDCLNEVLQGIAKFTTKR
jgi:hypothetical protein